MATEDTWHLSRRGPSGEKVRSARYGRGLQWRVRWYEHGRERSKAFRTKGEADRFDLRLRTEPVRPERSDVLVEELAEQLQATKSGLSAKTQEMYGNGARHVLAAFSGREAVSLAPSEIRVWVAGLQTAHGTPASGSLKQQALLTLSSMLDLAVEDGLLEVNPATKVTVGRGGRREGRFLTMDELVRLARAAGPYELMVLFMGTTGLRVGEACALRVGSIDFARGRARIHRSLSVAGEGKTKTRKGRDVPLPQQVADRLIGVVDGRDPDEHLFLSPAGRPINSQNWRVRVLRVAAKAAGLEGVRPHDLRHTAASLAIRSGATVKAVQEMLGHANPTMTLGLYAHLWDDQLDEVGVRMNGLLRQALKDEGETE